MVFSEFVANVDKHQDLEGVGKNAECVIIKHKVSGVKTRIPLSIIENTPWGDLESVMTEKRPPHVLHQVSRVVGYFSTIENWNESKKGELADRHKGDYTIR